MVGGAGDIVAEAMREFVGGLRHDVTVAALTTAAARRIADSALCKCSWYGEDPYWGRLASEAGITAGTLTGVLSTLERRGFAKRAVHPSDKRRVIVSPTARGRRAVDEIMPLFNRHEAQLTVELSPGDKRELSRLLRTVLRTLQGVHSTP